MASLEQDDQNNPDDNEFQPCSFSAECVQKNDDIDPPEDQIYQLSLVWPNYFKCCQTIPGNIITNAFGISWRITAHKVVISRQLAFLQITSEEWKDIVKAISDGNESKKPYDCFYENIESILTAELTANDYIQQFQRRENFNLVYALIEVLCIMDAAFEFHNHKMDSGYFVAQFEALRNYDEEYAPIIPYIGLEKIALKTSKHYNYCLNTLVKVTTNENDQNRHPLLIEMMKRKEPEIERFSYHFSSSLYLIILQNTSEHVYFPPQEIPPEEEFIYDNNELQDNAVDDFPSEISNKRQRN